MNKAFPILPAALLLALGSQQAMAQAPVLYNTISGVVWSDNSASSNGIREVGEERLGGILVSLVHDRSGVADTVVSTTLSDNTGTFTLNNYVGTGTFYIDYAFPSEGFAPSTQRAGPDDQLSSAADPTTAGNVDNNIVSSSPIVISSNANITNQGLGLQRLPNTVTYWVLKPVTTTLWNDNFTLPKADSAYGTMNRTTFFTTDAVRHPSIGLENTGAGSTLGTVEANGRVTFTPPTGATFETNTLARKVEDLATYDNTTDYDGASGANWAECFSGSFNTRVITQPAQLNSYRGISTGTISVGAAATSVASVIGSGNLVASVLTNSGVGVFVTYTYAAPIPLATRLLSFEAAVAGPRSNLSWTHAITETATGFAVERSINGRDFSALGFVPAEEGRTTAAAGTREYVFADAVPAPGNNYYRLKQTDASGRSAYSMVRTVGFGGSAQAYASYPNPADAYVTATADAGTRVVLHDALGRVVVSVMADASGAAVVPVASLPEGIYSLRTESRGKTFTERLVVQHK